MSLSDLEVKDSIFDPNTKDRTARWRNPKSDTPFYRVFLYLDGPKLPYVNAVTYVLHPTFDEPTRQVYRTPENPNCKLELWTWGIFRVQAIVTDRQGNMTTLTHDLEYPKEYQHGGVKFVAA
jgi:transcription initiation factor IIF auxiliary subunit